MGMTDSYCVGVEGELLELFPKVKSSGLRLDLMYEDEFVGEVNIESDADLKTALTTFYSYLCSIRHVR